MATKRTTLKGGIGSLRGSSGAAHSSKFGNKIAPGDSALPRQLRPTQGRDLAGSPKGRTVGPLDDSAGPPPVSATKRGRKGTPINS